MGRCRAGYDWGPAMAERSNVDAGDGADEVPPALVRLRRELGALQQGRSEGTGVDELDALADRLSLLHDLDPVPFDRDRVWGRIEPLLSADRDADDDSAI